MSARRDRPSEEQRRAMEARGRHLLVSAAAGSGKTFTLVERIVQSLIEGRYSIDELLVVTFTNAAAAEMRERIGRKLTAEAGAHPALARQLVLLPGADISTLHAFCQRLIRAHFAALDIDPKFRILNEQEGALLRRRAVAALFERRYEAEDAAFLRFAEAYGSDRDDEALYRMVLELYDFARSQPDPERWLAELPAAFELPEGTAIEETIWYPELRRQIGRTLAACDDAASYLSERAARDGLDAASAALAADAEKIAALRRAESGGWADMRAAFAAALGGRSPFAAVRYPRGAEVDEAAKKYYSDRREAEIKKPLRALYEAYFIETEETLLDDLRAVREEAGVLCGLAADFARDFGAEKKKRAALDFGDLEHAALALLDKEEAAAPLRARYREIMVDEYQDTNGVQEAILQRLTNGRNLFMVGDVKQSIYRFRLADPMLFMEKNDAYARAGGAAGERVGLRDNYRSRGAVLAAVNFLFAQLMMRPEMELDYDAEAALYAKADYPAAEGASFADAPVELVLVEKGLAAETDGAEKEPDGPEELKGFAAEAEAVARRLGEMKQSGVLVFDKDERAYRPVRWRDMAILLRAAQGRAQTLVETLRAHGIPAYAEADAGYFAETEVRLMLSLLAVIDNAHQDIPLAAVLHSAIGGMTAEALAAIRADAPPGAADFYAAVAAEAAHRPDGGAALFLSRLARWRSLSRRVGVPELLWRLYRETGYYDYAGAQPGGLVRQANLRMLADRAADYEKTNFRGLFRFLQFVRQMRDRGTDLAVARTLGEKEDVVRVMTVHKSKGLEFPVVVLAGLAKKFNLQDAQKSLLLHTSLGLGPFRTETEGTLAWRYPTIARRAVAARIRAEAKAEEMRVLYVALTRAREKLILTGSIGSLERQAMGWCRFAGRAETPLPGHAVLGAGSWLDWVGMALARGEAGACLREAADCGAPARIAYDAAVFGEPRLVVRVVPAPRPAEEETRAADDPRLSRIARLEPLPVEAEPARLAALSWRYGFRTDIPAKLTVTEIKRRMAEADDDAAPLPAILAPDAGTAAERIARDFPPPAFLAPEADAPGGMAFGTLMHGVMQRLRLDGALDEADIGAQLDGFAAEGLMSGAERRAVRAAPIARFFASPLGLRMRAARRLWREQPFSLLLPAKDVVPDSGASGGDEIFLQGVIDVFFEDARGRIVLLDYKTDRGLTPDALRARYRVQLALYARAIRQITGRPVDETYLYRLMDGDVVAL